MSDLYPTKTRVELLRLVSKEWIRREYSHAAGVVDMDTWSGRKANGRVAEVAVAGWVELDEKQFSTGTHGFLVRYWRLTDAGRAVLNVHGGVS